MPVDFEGSWPSIKIGYNSDAGSSADSGTASGAGVGCVTTMLGTVVGVVAGAVGLGVFRGLGVFMAPVLSSDVSCTSKASSSRGSRRVVPVVVLSAILGEVVAGG